MRHARCKSYRHPCNETLCTPLRRPIWFEGSSGEDTFDDLNQETLDLIQSGKLDISQICQEKVTLIHK